MRIACGVLAFACAVVPVAAGAQIVSAKPELATLTVAGNGSVDSSPDVARVSVQITTSDDDAAQSAGKNTAIYDALTAKLATLGLTGEAVRTTSFNVQYVPYPPHDLPPDQRQARYGYVTNRSLSIAVTPIENAGKVIDAANAAGVTSVGDVSYELKDTKAAYRAALAAAMKDAQADAAAIAAAANLHLVRIVGVSSGGFAMLPRILGRAMAAPAAESAAPLPTDLGPSGPLTTTASLTVTFEIR